MRRKQMRRVLRERCTHLDAEQADALLARAGIDPDGPAGDAVAVEQFVALLARRDAALEPTSVAVGQREAQPLELHRHVHRLHA